MWILILENFYFSVFLNFLMIFKTKSFIFFIGIVMVVSYFTISLRRNIYRRMWLLILWNNCFRHSNIFIQRRFPTEISNLRILCSTKKMIWLASKWLILVYQKISPNKTPCTLWVDLHTTLLQKSFCKSTIQKLIFGLWGLCCILCCLVKCHFQDVLNMKLFKM